MKCLKIFLRFDHCGNLLMDPANKRIRAQCKRRIVSHHAEGSPELHTGWQRDDTHAWLMRQACCFLQFEDAIAAAIEDCHLSRADNRDLQSGWEICKLMSVDMWEHYFTYANGMPSDY